MDVTINETSINVPVEAATWGDVLDWLETEHLKAGQCITHVYLGGNEAYNYRDQLICAQDLEGVGNIAIQSGDFDLVVRESMTELDQELKASLASTSEIIRLLENRNEEEAYNLLGQLLGTVG